MSIRKTIQVTFALALLVAGNILRAEEQHSIITALNSTTLSGYVDTSASWWFGAPGSGLPGRTSGPPNDDINAAEIVNAVKASIPTNLTESTVESLEPTQPQQTGSIWYKWTASKTGVARISTSAIIPVTEVAAVSTSPALSEESIFYPDGGITLVTGGSFTSTENRGGEIFIGYRKWWADLAVYRFIHISETEAQLEFVQRGLSFEFNAQADETFLVAVEVYQNTPAYEGQGEIPSILPTDVYFDLTSAPLNDSFSSSYSIADSSTGVMAGYTLAATREEGEPNLGGAHTGASVWFHYTAATYGNIQLGSSYNTAPVAIFTGDSLSNLTLVIKSEGGPINFFGQEGKVYHIAVYYSPASSTGFVYGILAPRYRLYETTLDALFPGDQTPHFYGVRGVTMLLYAKQLGGWRLVEVEPIVNRAADLLIRPAYVIDGQLRVLTIDEPLPSPRVVLRKARWWMAADLVGIPGQTCAISFSTDLVNWSQPQVITLKASVEPWGTFMPDVNYFFRVTQSLPLPQTTPNPIGVVIHTNGGNPSIPPPIPAP